MRADSSDARAHARAILTCRLASIINKSTLFLLYRKRGKISQIKGSDLQPLSLKSSQNTMENSETTCETQNSAILQLPALTNEEINQCMPHGSQRISGLEQANLPFVKKDHDLAEILTLSVIKDVSGHPKKPLNEAIATILCTGKLANMVLSEMKRYGLAMKAFSNALGMNSASFSLALREPRHWFDTNLVQVMISTIKGFDLKIIL